MEVADQEVSAAGRGRSTSRCSGGAVGEPRAGSGEGSRARASVGPDSGAAVVSGPGGLEARGGDDVLTLQDRQGAVRERERERERLEVGRRLGRLVWVRGLVLPHLVV